MNGLIAQLRRIVAVCAIVIFSGAMTCTTIEGGITFAPGYGYVIVVEHGPKNEHAMYVFDTKEAADKWAFNFQQSPGKLAAMGEPGYKFRLDEGREEDRDLFWKIWRARQPIPPVAPSGVTRTIDQVVPPVPTAPAPQ